MIVLIPIFFFFFYPEFCPLKVKSFGSFPILELRS